MQACYVVAGGRGGVEPIQQPAASALWDNEEKALRSVDEDEGVRVHGARMEALSLARGGRSSWLHLQQLCLDV